MNRRGFLLSGTAMAACLAWRGTAAGPDAHHHEAPPAVAAADPAALPAGAPLPDLARLPNRAAAPGRFEAGLTAGPAEAAFLPGTGTAILGYEGIAPGPLIELVEGDAVAIAFRNAIPGEETTVHWHGLPVPFEQDGHPRHAVPPGGARDYAFTLPAGVAGSYWYHPHPHGLTAQQVYRGLAGPLIVRPKADPIPAAYGDTPLFVTDLRLAADASIPHNTMADWMNGRIGDHLLVNGAKAPVLTLPAGTHRRFRLWNATSARFLRLTFGGLPITLIGTDGGFVERPVPLGREIMMVPAERAEIIVPFESPGEFSVTTLPYDAGWMGGGRPETAGHTLLTVRVTAERAAPPPPLPETLREIETLPAPVLTRSFIFREDLAMMEMMHDPGPAPVHGMDHGNMAHDIGKMPMDGAAHGGIDPALAPPPLPMFSINGAVFDMGRADLTGRTGDVELWEIRNPTDMDHPFHLHGDQFQIVEWQKFDRIRRPPFRGWKDTVNIARAETVRLLVRQRRPGLWLYHCHILEHETLGMMGQIEISA
jgi:bilirubin oxidase